MPNLLNKSPAQWLDTVLADFDAFLIDHAACERKASAMAMSMICHYPDKPKLVSAMTALAVEELNHFKQVIDIILQRNLILKADTKDPYVNQLRKLMRTDSENYFLDRLLMAGIIEARGCERFGMIADGLGDTSLGCFYEAITRSEAKHEDLFIQLALDYFPDERVQQRLDELLSEEATIIDNLALRAALH